MTTAILNEVRNIPLGQLEASRSNPRRTMHEEDLKDLAASIREFGVTVPLLVRADPAYADNDNESRYEIVCGHRRSEAATLAGLTEVPCMVRALSDEQAAEIAIVDNLQRVDVPPLEEAEAFRELLERLFSIPAVAVKVGKEQAYVARRLRLLSLTIYSRDALREKLITIEHALLLARLAEAEQNQALKWCLDRNAGSKTGIEKVIAERLKRNDPEGDDEEPESNKARRPDSWNNHSWEPETVQKLKAHIECESGLPLDRAPWPMEEDYLLPDAGSCLDCEKNTKANAPLFGDMGFGVAVCTDGACFAQKTSAFVEIQLRAAGQDLNAKQKKYVPRLSWKSSSIKPGTCFNDVSAAGAMTSTANPAKLLKYGQWIDAKKGSCPNVRPGVTADWDDGRGEKLRKPGELVTCCIACGCKVHKKSYENAKAAPVDRNQNSEANRAKREDLEKLIKVENDIRIGIVRAALAKVDKLSPNLLRLIVSLNSSSCYGEEKKRFPNLEKTLETSKVESAEFARAAASTLFLEDNTENLWVPAWGDSVELGRDELINLIRALGYDASKAWDKPKAEKPVAPKKPAVKKPTKPAAKKAAKKAVKKGGRK